MLDRCLEQLFASSGPTTFEVIVVDNGSVDGSVDMITSKYPAVRVIPNVSNRYFTTAHNQSLRLSRGRLLLIMNSDILVFPDTLKRMAEFMDQHQSAAAASCQLLNADGSVDRTCWQFRTVKSILFDHRLGLWLFPNSLERKTAQILDWDRRSTRPVDVISDAFMCIRTDVMAAIGGYDESMLLYYTEDDICLRLHLAGWDVYHNSEASAVHYGQFTSRRQSAWTIWWLRRRDAVVYFTKHHGWFPAQFLNLFWTIDIVFRVPLRKLMDAWETQFKRLNRSSID